MLYITTRNDRETYTAHRAFQGSRSPDGGMYLPYRPPAFSREDLEALLNQGENGCMAQVLNHLCAAGLSGWELDFSIGRRPFALETLGHRIVVGQIWHNAQDSYDYLTRELIARVLGNWPESVGNWAGIAVNIAVLFGLFARLRQEEWPEPVDVAVVAGDFSWPISAWYARQWGLPVGQIICCCNENNNLWELFHQGQLRTDALCIPTGLPAADVALPADLERLIYACGGTAEVESYVEACRKGRPYCPEEGVLAKMRRGISVSVVSSQRMASMIRNVDKTYGCRLSPDAALAYGGVMDYRSKGGQYRPCLILSGEKPHNSQL